MYYSEKFNSYSHLIGVFLAIFATVMLIIKAVSASNNYKVVAACIYGTSLIMVYGLSTIYHSTWQLKIKAKLQVLDCCVIYLLIAGSYTPFALVTLHGGWGWSIFGVSWGLAVVGLIQELIIGTKTRVFSLLLYLIMGWLAIVAVKPIVNNLPLTGLLLLIAGGLVYTIGVYWFINDQKIKHAHGIWHLFVLGGSILHYICIYGWVI